MDKYILYYTIPYYTILYYTILYYTILYYHTYIYMCCKNDVIMCLLAPQHKIQWTVGACRRRSASCSARAASERRPSMA